MSINAPGIPALDTIGYLIYPWFMCLLFVVSGICARISLEKRNGRAFVRDRARRLLFAFPFLYSVHRAPGFRAFHPGKQDPRSVCVPAGMGGVLYQGSSGNGAVLVPSAAVRFIRMFGGDQESGQKGRLSALGEKCTLPILLLLYFPVLASAQILYIAYTFRVGLYLLLFLMGYYVFTMKK